MTHDIFTNGLEVLMLTTVSPTAALVGIALAVEADDVVPARSALRCHCEASLTSLDAAIADCEVLPCCELHQLCCDAQGNGALDLWSCFQASL